MPQPAPTKDYVVHYDPGRAHHRAWLQAVLDRLIELDPKALDEGSRLRVLWKDAPEAQPMAFALDEVAAMVAAALPLVKDFEGCKLDAYPDPETGAEPWTIGWGSTAYDDGRPVRQGDRITQQQADALLHKRLIHDATRLISALPIESWRAMNVNQRAALLSFSYNCGPYWYGSAGYKTLTLHVRNRAWGEVPGALMLYVNPGGPSEAGLRRRRKAEGALWSADPGGSRPLSLRAIPPRPPARPSTANPLAVPKFLQRDSGTDQGARMCFSSSNAMLLEFLRPGTLKGPNGDDEYLKVVRRFGDTTDANAQLKALKHFGVTARMEVHANFDQIEKLIDAGIPVPCGYIHRGPVERPRGGGHWLIVIGYTATHVVVNDPFGEPDLITGATLSRSGMGIRLTRKNFGRRWMVEPIGDGSYRYAPGRGWAIVAEK